MKRVMKDLEAWLLDSAADPQMIDRVDDLHIDEVSAKWRDRTTWVPGALECYDAAYRLKELHSVELVLAVALYLDDDTVFDELRSIGDVASTLSYTPPSLRLYRREETPWRMAKSFVARRPGESYIAKEIELEGLPLPRGVRACYLTEYRAPETPDPSKGLFLASSL